MVLRKLWHHRSIVREAWHRTMAVANFLCGLHVTNTYLCTAALAYGPSMLPTFNLTGDLFLAERLSTRFDKVRPGDVVLVRSPEDPRKLIVKRLLGMEGDSVTYVVDPKNSSRCDTVVVPKGHVWIEGDNIYASRDSRQVGPVPYSLLEGKAFCKVPSPLHLRCITVNLLGEANYQLCCSLWILYYRKGLYEYT
ncbi:mitochondrial inner membrane protease subunit 1-like isoform X1 [Juglans regia]|uniref:Mitochondrial inner membrane protease subunit 1-like isoform X1 n=1 Tax=Juglans regia TaxID=51240 RepID=A0A6P9E920_JUGRE|nr:mitochondrial inner membrane protease subunit 1-like isoform X1 [Juglans regia]